MKKLFSMLVALCALMTQVKAQNTGYAPGDMVTDFKLKGTDGKAHSLAELSNNDGVILTFTCNHCPYAKAYEDRVIALHKQFAAQGYPVVAINPNDPAVSPEDSFEKMKERAKSKKFPFAYLFDDTQDVAKRFGATRTPHIYLLKKTPAGTYQVVYVGAIDDNWEDASAVKQKYVEQAIADLKANKDVAVKQTKAIGCTIKWKKA
jgi:peroxiredoxin